MLSSTLASLHHINKQTNIDLLPSDNDPLTGRFVELEHGYDLVSMGEPSFSMTPLHCQHAKHSHADSNSSMDSFTPSLTRINCYRRYVKLTLAALYLGYSNPIPSLHNTDILPLYIT